jgi:hypothetical protein
VALPLALSWGEAGKVITIQAGDDVKPVLGYDLADAQLLPVREALKRAQTLLLYRLNAGTKATATAGNLTATAKYGGLRGNDITIVIQQNIDDNTKFDVKTMVVGDEADTQTVTDISVLVSNAWVIFSGSGTLTVSAGAPLIGGADGTATNADHTSFQAAVELFDFNTIGLNATDDTLKSVYVSFIKRLRDQEGKEVQLILENYPAADYEGVISVKNGVVLSDGTVLTAAQATAWVAGATAGAQVNESLTYDAYDDAIDVSPRFTNSQIEAALLAGEFVFTPNGGRAVVEQDINTFTSFTPDKKKHFSKNRVIRVLDGLRNDFMRIFAAYYIGQVDNNDDGRGLFRKECVNQIETYQNINAVQNFDSQNDITVTQGTDSDAVYVEFAVQPVDSIEKIYVKAKVK